MKCRAMVVASALLAMNAACWAEMPYPPNPQPCAGPQVPPGCIAATDFSRYLFLPTTSPLTLPNDFNNDWKLSSTKTGEAAIDNNPQELFGVKGASVDLAFQVTTGRPDVVIAVLDSGIRWQERLDDLVNKFYLNRGELPVPEGSTNARDPWDRSGDGVFNMADYLADGVHPQDSRVSDQNGNGVIDPEDLIFIFSDGVDDDHNGYVDDISGWDFFEDDNDALDEVRYGHGTGEAHDSNAEANNGGDLGTCPSCMVLMVRVGDSFVAEVNAFAQGVLFAVDSGARVVQEALGTLNNSGFAQAAVDYAYHHGVVVMASAADEESNHHNYPANYRHTIDVNSVTKFQELAGMEQTPHSYLFLNGCTNYGAHIALSIPSSSCSSEATGKSSGVAGLINAAALNEIDRGHLTRYPNGDGSFAAFPLSAEEVKQLLTMTADDINFDARPDANPPLPQNYQLTSPFPGVQHSERYPSIAGFDQFFGYGRLNAHAVVRRVAAGTIPPEVTIESPGWFHIVDPSAQTLDIQGRVAANRAASYSYRIEVAPGVQPAEQDFMTVDMTASQSAPHSGVLGHVPLAALAARMPHGTQGPAIDVNGQPDADRFTFTVRVRASDNLGNLGEDRRALFLHHDADLLTAAPLQLGSDGAASPVLADLNGDGIEEIILATSDGLVHAFKGSQFTELPGWPVHSDPLEIHDGTQAFASGEVHMPVYAAILGGPAVGDIDHDGRLEVVATDMQGKVYVWDRTGQLRPGFPVETLADYSNTRRSERDLSTPAGRVPDRTNRHTPDNRLARAIGAGPALGNLDNSADGSLEIIVGASDRHVYAWHNDGTPVHGWPVLLKDPTKVQSVDPVSNEIVLTSNAHGRMGSKIITPPSLGDIDGDGTLNVVQGVNEEYSERPNAVFNNLLIQLYQVGGVLNSGNGRLYALFPDGAAHGSTPLDHGWNPAAFLPGWPAKVPMLITELLPTVGTGINAPPALADLNKDGKPEIAVASCIGPAIIFDGQGHSFFDDARPGQARTLEADTFGAFSNSVDAPAYPAVGGGVLAEMAGPTGGFQFVAPTAGIGRAGDANLAGKQTPADNQLGVWDVASADGSVGSGEFRPAFPRVVTDLQFLTSPAVADITGDGLPEAIEGSGVYDLHAININGVEPPDWPKLTGGWMTATAAVGDINGDARAEVVTVTREGYLFVWATGASECSPAPWRKYHHDEWGTGNYATDARPPAPLLPQMTSIAGLRNGTVSISLQAVPGDDLYCGGLPQFDVRYATQPLLTDEQFAAAAQFRVLELPSAVGRYQAGSLLLQPAAAMSGTVNVAARTIDNAGNRSPITQLGQATLTIVACRGDCNGDVRVTVDELVTLVNIAVESQPLSACVPGDINSDGQVTIDEVIVAVKNALGSCASSI